MEGRKRDNPKQSVIPHLTRNLRHKESKPKQTNDCLHYGVQVPHLRSGGIFVLQLLPIFRPYRVFFNEWNIWMFSMYGSPDFIFCEIKPYTEVPTTQKENVVMIKTRCPLTPRRTSSRAGQWWNACHSARRSGISDTKNQNLNKRVTVYTTG